MKIKVHCDGDCIESVEYRETDNPGRRLAIKRAGKAEERWVGRDIVQWQCSACGEVFWTKSNLGGYCPVCREEAQPTWGELRTAFVPEQ